MKIIQKKFSNRKNKNRSPLILDVAIRCKRRAGGIPAFTQTGWRRVP